REDRAGSALPQSGQSRRDHGNRLRPPKGRSRTAVGKNDLALDRKRQKAQERSLLLVGHCPCRSLDRDIRTAQSDPMVASTISTDRPRPLSALLTAGHPLVMGILNVTPDSFSDGGRFFDPDVAATRARQMVADGGDNLDVVGQHTRPYSR